MDTHQEFNNKKKHDMFTKQGKETMAEEEARIKAEFKKAARSESDSDDIMVKKAKVSDSESEE